MSVFSGLDKLKDALDDAIHDDRSDKIKAALDRDDEEHKKKEDLLRLKTEKEKAEAKERIKDERGLSGKIQDLLDHGEARKKQEEAEFARIDAEAKDEHHKMLGLRGKILDVLDGPDARPAGSKPAAEHGLKDRVSDLWGSHATQKAEEQEDVGDKILDVLAGNHGKKQKEKEAQKSWFASKVREMAGGGQAGELDEDKLDKAVDLFQQRILKEGDQSDESAIEQLKDEQIANAIRHSFKSVTGHELPKGK